MNDSRNGDGHAASDPSLYGDVRGLIKAARGGSKHELGNLLEPCRRYLLLVADKELDDDLKARGGASDLVQETFLDAQRGFDRFRGRTEAELLGWLRRILLNNMTDFARHNGRARERGLNQQLPLHDHDSQRGDLLWATCDAPTPSTTAMALELAKTVADAIEQLPKDYAEVVRLRNIELLQFEEIGVRMERSTGAVSRLWSRAIDRLGQVMEKSHGVQRP